MNKLLLHMNVQWKAYFDKLAPQDQRALSLLAGFLLVVFCWLGLWRPVESMRENNEASYQSARADFEWMQAHAGQVSPAQSTTAGAAASGDILSQVTNIAGVSNVTIDHAEPAGDGMLDLTFEHVPFSRLLAFLDTMSRTRNIYVRNASVERIATEAGFVRAALTVEAK